MLVPKDITGSLSRESIIRREYPEFYEYLYKNYPEDIAFKEKLYWYFHNITEYPVCPVCGKRVKFINQQKGYFQTCSYTCLNHNPEFIAKRNKTLKDKGLMLRGEKKQATKEKQRARLEIKAKREAMQMARPRPPKPVIVQRPKEIFTPIFGNLGIGMQCTSSFMDICSKNKYQVPQRDDIPNILDDLEGDKLMPLPLPEVHGTVDVRAWVRSILDKYNVEYLEDIDDVVPGVHMDIYVPDKMTALSCNQCYEHSSACIPSTYHMRCFSKCLEQNIRLFQVWEDWVYNTPDILESMIRNLLHLGLRKVYARQCELRDVDNKVCAEFFNANHIQGKTASQVRLGLYLGDELLTIMTFGHKRAGMASQGKPINPNEWELTRFCSKRNCSIVGGASKLYKEFIKRYHPEIVFSWSSNDISIGNVYQKLGFKRETKMELAYWYVEQGTYVRMHRYSFSRYGITRRWPEYKLEDKRWTERAVMSRKPFWKINDAGTSKWTIYYQW